MVFIIKACTGKSSMFGHFLNMNSLSNKMHLSHLEHIHMDMPRRQLEREIWKENMRLKRGSYWAGDVVVAMLVGDTAKGSE